MPDGETIPFRLRLRNLQSPLPHRPLADSPQSPYVKECYVTA